MNTMGDGEDDPEVPALSLPLSAPVAADMGQSRTDHHPYAAHPAVPVTVWPAPVAADDLPPGHPYAAHPTPASAPPPVSAPRPPAACFPLPVPPVSTPVDTEPAANGTVTTTVAPPEPAVSAPAATEPAASDTADDDTSTAGPAIPDAAAVDPTLDEPTLGDPTLDEPTLGDPTLDEPTPDELAADDSASTADSARSGRDGHVAAVGRRGDERAPESPAHGDYLFPGGSTAEPPDDPNRVILRKQLDALRARAASAASWQETSAHYAQLVNSDGVVPITARFTGDDIEFLGRAREEVLGLAEFGLRLLDLHAPLDAGGISTDPSSPIMRCRSCMWRWPCPTFTLLSETVNQLPHPRSPLGR
jgi:hypothetical protein